MNLGKRSLVAPAEPADAARRVLAEHGARVRDLLDRDPLVFLLGAQLLSCRLARLCVSYI
jgi:hypothetical protein